MRFIKSITVQHYSIWLVTLGIQIGFGRKMSSAKLSSIIHMFVTIAYTAYSSDGKVYFISIDLSWIHILQWKTSKSSHSPYQISSI